MADALVQPKKPTAGGFGQFTAEKRKDFMEQCKGKPVSEVSKLAGVEWKKLTKEEQVPYQQKFEAASKKYKEDMEAFLAAGGEKQKGTTALRAEKRKARETKAAKKAAKDPNAPKRPAGGGYGCYLAKHREAITKECAGKPITAVSKLAGERWKALTASEKEPYEKDYAAKKEEFEKAMESYVPPPKAEGEEEEEEDDEEEEEEEAAESPAKKAKTEKAKKSPQKAATVEAKAKPKGKAKAKAKGEEAVDIPKDVLAKAEKADMVAPLKKLLMHDDIKSAGISAGKAFDALSEKNGLLHPARRVLLGA